MYQPDSITGYLRELTEALARRGLIGTLQRALGKLFEMSRPEPRLFTAEEALEFYQRCRANVGELKQEAEIPKVSILLLTYNNLVVSKACLHSIYCNTSYPNFEVIAVDNASSDGTAEWLKDFAAAHVNMKLVLNPENRGFSAGNNQAAQLATGDYLVFLNNDTIVTPRWLEGMLAYLLGDPKIGMVGPMTNSTSNEARLYVRYDSPGSMQALASYLAHTRAGRAFDIRMLALYCVMVRHNEFLSLGGLDESFGMGMFEDEDLAIRYKEQGFRVVCAEDVFIHHFWRATFSKLARRKYAQLFAHNRNLFEEKWGRRWEPYQYSREYSRPGASDREKLAYRCNVCGRTSKTAVTALAPLKQTCACGSTVIGRAIVHLLSLELFGRSLVLEDFPERPGLRGIWVGSSEQTALVRGMLEHVGGSIEFWPRLDMASPLGESVAGNLDFLIMSQTEEIGPGLASRVSEMARWLLKPGGVLILALPFMPQAEEERLHGEVHFSRIDIVRRLQEAGFETVEMDLEPCWEHGIYWMEPALAPIQARKAAGPA